MSVASSLQRVCGCVDGGRGMGVGVILASKVGSKSGKNSPD